MGYEPQNTESDEVNEFLVQYGDIDNQDPFVVVQRSLEGIAAHAFKGLTSLMLVPEDSVAKLLGTNERTFRNHAAQKKLLNPQTSEHILRIADLYKYGIDVFGTKKSFNNWLKKPSIAFDQLIPWKMLQTSGGVHLVKDEVLRIAYGELA